jgi:signal transduction histidine kinase
VQRAAALQPVDADADSRLLASLPARLVPGRLPPAGPGEPAGAANPLRLSLTIAWACVLLASGAVAMLLRGAVALGERRGAFVSAVTHELRTPLTTLRMYSEMLAEGMVGDDRRPQYLATLRAEADRLGHLVDNVLAYSRLERRRDPELTAVPLGEVLARGAGRLEERARQAGMVLRIEVPPEAAAAVVSVNPLALEQILFNLVDNACKYARGAAGRTVELRAAAAGGGGADAVALSVRDHGPGFPPAAGARWYRPFSKTSQQAAETAPGLGLGLALSRRIARSMGGDLRVESPPGGGAVVTVTLRRAR